MQSEQTNRIQILMNINNFINSINDTIKNKLKNIVQHVAAQIGFEKNAESDEKNIEQSKIKISDALVALWLLQLYEKQQNDENSTLLHLLNKYEQQIQDRKMKES